MARLLWRILLSAKTLVRIINTTGWTFSNSVRNKKNAPKDSTIISSAISTVNVMLTGIPIDAKAGYNHGKIELPTDKALPG